MEIYSQTTPVDAHIRLRGIRGIAKEKLFSHKYFNSSRFNQRCRDKAVIINFYIMYLLFCCGLPEGNISRESNEVPCLDPDFALISDCVLEVSWPVDVEEIVLVCVGREGGDLPVCLAGCRAV